MRKAKHTGQDPWLAILDFRNTPSQGIGESPCQQLINRRTKTLMPVKESLLSSVGDRANIKKMRKEKDRQSHCYNRTTKDVRELQPGDTVRMKPTHSQVKEWRKRTIIGREGSGSYHVQTQDGAYRRNRSHLQDTREELNDFIYFRISQHRLPRSPWERSKSRNLWPWTKHNRPTNGYSEQWSNNQ